tara:strand:+ start:5031 stop:6158 length:1128 start_codon:yes stop_codon:yes gene_type:complete
MYADRENIYYSYNVLQPNKDETYDWDESVSGETSKTEWKNYFSFEDLPKLRNPESGWLINTNNAPAYVTKPFGLIEHSLPKYAKAESDSEGLRGRRIINLIESQETITQEDMKTFATDTYIQMAEYVVPTLLETLRELNSSDLLILEAITILENWDYFSSKESEAMSLFWYWYILYGGIGYTPEEVISFNETEKINVTSTFNETVQYFNETFGTLQVTWGSMHLLNHNPEIQLAGGDATLSFDTGLTSLYLTNADIFNETTGTSYSESGSTYIRVVELSDPPKIYTMKPKGQSGNPESIHYDDLSFLYGNQEFKELYFELDDILENLESTTTLSYATLEPIIQEAPKRDNSIIILVVTLLLILAIHYLKKGKRKR